MEINIDRTHWYDRLWAALIFFTRLPFWRLHQPPRECYAAVVEWWPLAGWLTGGVMAAVLYLAPMVMPYPVAVLLAILARILLTGALHEDGLADFVDGFGGGGNDRQRTLDIMKDSRIGTYGVIGLVLYLGLLFLALLSMPCELAALTVLAADPFGKMMAAQLVNMMPYARTAQTAKSGAVYRHPTPSASILLAIQGLLPLVPLLWLYAGVVEWSTLLSIPALLFYLLYLLIWHRLRGYTGDCCGAACLLTELAFVLVACAQAQP